MSEIVDQHWEFLRETMEIAGAKPAKIWEYFFKIGMKHGIKHGLEGRVEAETARKAPKSHDIERKNETNSKPHVEEEKSFTSIFEAQNFEQLINEANRMWEELQ